MIVMGLFTLMQRGGEQGLGTETVAAIQTDVSPTPLVAAAPSPNATTAPSATPAPVHPTPTVPPATVTRAATATATTVPKPVPGTVFQADWSIGPDGWPPIYGWRWVSAMLVNDGSNTNDNNWPAAPWDLGALGVTDYVVEAEVQRVRLNCGSTYGIVVRSGYVNGYGGCPPQFAEIRTLTGDQLVYKGADLDNEWHVYRIEMFSNTIKLFIDGGLVVQAVDNRYLHGGRVGLLSKSAQINVRSFKVITR